MEICHSSVIPVKWEESDRRPTLSPQTLRGLGWKDAVRVFITSRINQTS